jgi:hypothetical protein
VVLVTTVLLRVLPPDVSQIIQGWMGAERGCTLVLERPWKACSCCGWQAASWQLLQEGFDISVFSYN